MIPMIWSVVLGVTLLGSAIFAAYALFATFSPYVDHPRPIYKKGQEIGPDE